MWNEDEMWTSEMVRIYSGLSWLPDISIPFLLSRMKALTKTLEQFHQPGSLSLRVLFLFLSAVGKVVLEKSKSHRAQTSWSPLLKSVQEVHANFGVFQHLVSGRWLSCCCGGQSDPSSPSSEYSKSTSTSSLPSCEASASHLYIQTTQARDHLCKFCCLSPTWIREDCLIHSSPVLLPVKWGTNFTFEEAESSKTLTPKMHF